MKMFVNLWWRTLVKCDHGVVISRFTKLKEIKKILMDIVKNVSIFCTEINN